MEKKSKRSELLKMSAKDLLMTGLVESRQEEIEVSSVVRESALIDQQHSQNLAESMMGERKQISPITVRVRLENGKIVHDIIDGFHRAEAMRLIEDTTSEKQTLKAVVLYGCKDEELFDLRVLAASSVRSIKFARMAEWMKNSFLSTEWKNYRIGQLIEDDQLTLSQVFNLAQFNQNGKNLGLKENEAGELKQWAIQKSKLWGKNLSTLMTEMRTVELANPELVRMVRMSGGGKDGKGVLTKARLEAIVDNLPGEWELQMSFANLAINQNVLAPDLDFLAWTYVQAREARDEETMTQALNDPQSLLNPVSKAQYEEVKSSIKNVAPELMPRQKGQKSKNIIRSMLSKNKKLDVKDTKVDNENVTFTKKYLAEVLNSLIGRLASYENADLIILSLPDGDICLNRGTAILSFSGREIKLTPKESELLQLFHFLEGMTLNDDLLNLVSRNKSTRPTINSIYDLKSKLESLSPSASDQLWIGRNKESSWLAE